MLITKEYLLVTLMYPIDIASCYEKYMTFETGTLYS